MAEEQAAYECVLFDAQNGSESASEAVREVSARLYWQIKAMSPQELSTHLRGTSGRVPYTTADTEIQEQPLLLEHDPGDLAERFAELNSAEFGPLMTGIDRAQKVLPGSYLFVLWTTRLTHYECCAQIARMTPFLTANAAQKFATDSLNEWLSAGAQAEPTEPGYRPQIAGHRVPIISYDSVQYNSQRWRNSTQVTAIVFGPFPTAIVGLELFDAFSAPVEAIALRNFFLAVSDDSYSRIETKICYAHDHPRRTYWGLTQGVQWRDEHIGDIVPDTRFSGPDSAAGLTPPSAAVPLRIVRRQEADVSGGGGRTAQAAARGISGWIKAQIRWNTGRVSEQDHLEWFENTRVTRLQGNDPIRWADVEPAPAATESTSPEASDERDRGF